jgi:two-component sensor histidine kinase/response regulator RpfG family c-di-GMP phosphodiesterase
MQDEKVNILLVDDQPAKLLTYEVILRELGDNLIMAQSGKEALEVLLKNEIAVVLMDVSMPELDGFELASMIREHPRFRKIAMIFVSAIHLAEIDHLRGYEMGAVDYVPVPVVPEVLRAKVRVFADLYRKNRQLERLNVELERRVSERTAELEASTARLLESEQRRSLALAAGSMGAWDWDLTTGQTIWDEGQHAIFGVVPGEFTATPEHFKVLIHPDDWERLQAGLQSLVTSGKPHQAEYRIRRPDGEMRWVSSTAAASDDASGKVVRISGVTMDITERKEAEDRQALLAREVDHRAKNAMAIVQSIVKLTKADNIKDYTDVIEGRIRALSRVHAILSDARWHGADLATLVDEELAPYRGGSAEIRTAGPNVLLDPTSAQTFTLALHELATNAVKYGALSAASGKLGLTWSAKPGEIVLEWTESGGPSVSEPSKFGFGTKIINGSIERQLGGKAEFDWDRGGLRCVLHIPRKEGVVVQGEKNGASAEGVAPEVIHGKRIMIVEDEALVAMILEDQLVDLGYSIAATCASVPDALKALGTDKPDAAILDVNLGGQLVYPVADQLMDRGIPFVFVTGYGRESVDQRYAAIQVLEKPVDQQALRGIFTSGDAAQVRAAAR